MTNEVSPFYHPQDRAWEDNGIEVQFYGHTIRLCDHITEEEYAKMTPQERQLFITKIGRESRQNAGIHRIELVSTKRR